MNFGLITSFVIAGILLLSILSMNNNVSQSSSQITMRQVMQQRTNDITDILQNDIPKIGYNISSTIPNSVTDAAENRIEFKSNINKDNSRTVETILWELTDIEVSSPNTGDYVLKRIKDTDITTIKSGVSKFKITYFNSEREKIAYNLLDSQLGGTQDERNKIKHIEIEVTVESPEAVGKSEDNYVTTSWKKSFTPFNLNI